MKVVLISHFYNEEFLLPHWIQHHVHMVDHGVMINYASTDRSVEIIKKMAPHWEIRPSRNRFFDAPLVDQEVMSIEREFKGYWKMALNTTEFLVMPELDLKRTLCRFLAIHPYSFAVAAHGMKMIDHKKDKNVPIDQTKPLLFQRHWGIAEMPGYGPGRERHRAIHRLPYGHYSIGRHSLTIRPVKFMPTELYCLWYGWSPYFHLKQRKLQVSHKLPVYPSAMGPGSKKVVSSVEELDKGFDKMTWRAFDLYTDKAFLRVVESCRGKFPDPYIPGRI